MLLQQVNTHTKTDFIPKLQSHFAEFLNYSLSNRLRILFSSTCVGLRYGLITFSLRSFSRKHRIMYLRHQISMLTSPRICLGTPPTSLNWDNQTPSHTIFLRHSFSQTNITKYRNINLLSIDYAFRPRLRSRLTLGGFT
jgi:hypothetical protein